jgi:hypothetical protein
LNYEKEGEGYNFGKKGNRDEGIFDAPTYSKDDRNGISVLKLEIAL